MSQQTQARVRSYANDFVDFVNGSPTPYHVVANAKTLLEKAGFTELRERDQWHVEPGSKYFVTRNASSIIAFGVGGKWNPGNGFAIVGAHTDSPTLRVKPVSTKQSDGYLQVGVETYGGGIWHSWFDRDLSLAGRVYIRSKSSGAILPKLIKIDRPILRIPTLAIHLDGSANKQFEFNRETEFAPIAGLVEKQLNKKDENVHKDDDKGDFSPLATMKSRHGSLVLEAIANEAKVQPDEIVDFELVLYDTHKSTLGGLSNEFIFSPRLDNQGMSYCAIRGLIDSVSSESLNQDPTIRVISLFDHEEIGSESAQGARSNFLPAILRRLSVNGDEYERSLVKSFLVSADMAHAVNPNYDGKYEANHKPELNRGPVIKINANQRYSTNSPGIVLLQLVAQQAKVPLQLFVVRNDSSCGSTIGPALASLTGVRTLDLGNPQLSMHSIRETGGAFDVAYGADLFSGFFNHYHGFESRIFVD